MYFEYSDANLVKDVKHRDGTMNYFAYDALQRRFAERNAAQEVQ